jgi:hypothetical protein
MSPFRLEAGNGSAFGSWCHDHGNPRRHRWQRPVLASSRCAICGVDPHRAGVGPRGTTRWEPAARAQTPSSGARRIGDLNPGGPL